MSAADHTQHAALVTQRSFPGWTLGFQNALERLTIATRRPARGQHAGYVRAQSRGRALEFADYRPYTPGDDPKLVDWRAYTRLGRLYLKQYEEERTRTLHLWIDTSGSLDWGEGETHKGWYARQLAAALAWIGLSRHEPVRATLLRDGSALPLPPLTTRAGVASFFQRLGAVRETGHTELAAAVRGASAQLPGGRALGPVVLLTDLLDPTWEEALGALAATGARADTRSVPTGGNAGGPGEGTVVQVLAPDEWEPPLGDEVELEDAETGELRATRLGPVELASYRERLEAILTEGRRRCDRLGLAYVALNTAIPLQDAVLRELPAAGILQS